MTQKIFDSFYFLHIRKNGGQSYTHNFLDPLKNIIKDSNIDWLSYDVKGNTHNQWINKITDFTYVTCIFREPCKQIVSTYVHNESFKSESKINKENFLKWFISDQGRYLYNNQSKNIVSPIIISKNGTFVYDEKLTTKENVLNKISKMSLFLKTQELTENNRLIIQNKILLDLNIKDAKINNVQMEENKYKNSHSKEIYESLSEKQKEHIASLCSIDSEIYETKNLFWQI
jgi:hypothetical protein